MVAHRDCGGSVGEYGEECFFVAQNGNGGSVENVMFCWKLESS
jgi:hypothetical protein